MIWMQTHREWGNGRVLRGNAHLMIERHGHEPQAACGYRPHARTHMVAVAREKLVDEASHRVGGVQRCPKCVKLMEVKP